MLACTLCREFGGLTVPDIPAGEVLQMLLMQESGHAVDAANSMLAKLRYTAVTGCVTPGRTLTKARNYGCMYSHLLQRTTATVSYNVGEDMFKLERTVGVPRLRMWPVARYTSLSSD